MTESAKLAAILPGYDIGAELGRGGYGVVLGGMHRRLGRPVAIKELPPKLAADPGVRARFVAEARVLASLDHPHIVPIYDFVEQDGICVLVMEALPGGTVWGRFSSTGYTPSAACAVVMVACAGVHYAHQHGVLHRDIKPENLLLTETGQLKVADFGIAKVLGDNDALATSSGEILGTPAYIAPEQAEGGELGPPADVYAGGVMLYELLSGRLPFSEEGGGLAIVYRHVYEQPVPLSDVAPGVPPGLAAVVMKALSRDPQTRYATAELFGVAIGEAATEAFGPGWFEDTAVPVLAGGPILASTRPLAGTTAASPAVGPPSPPLSSSGPAVGPPGPAAPPIVPSPVAPASPLGAGMAPPQRPATAVHVRGAAADSSAESLLPVRQVLVNPPWPASWAAVSAALLALLAVLALGSLASAPARPASGAVIVAGQDAARGVPVVDLAHPFELTMPAARAADQVTVALSIAGIPLVAPTVGKPRADGHVTVDARGSRYLAAGAATAHATASRAGRTLTTVDFPLRASSSSFATLPGVLAGIALLFSLAYAESQLGPLRRRGRRRLSSLVGLAVAGAALGALGAVFVWLLGKDLLLPGTVWMCAVTGAVAGITVGVTAYKAGRRARLRRIARKHLLAAA